MTTPSPSLPSRLSTALLLGLLVMVLSWGAWALSDRRTTSTLFAPPRAEGGPAFGGQLWVNWKDTPRGIEITEVHPLVTANPLLKGTYLQVGDVIKALDYEPITKPEVLDQIIQASPLGKVFVLLVERTGPQGLQGQSLPILVETSFEPLFSFSRNLSLWRWHLWLVVPGLLLSLVTLFIVFPTLRRRLGENWPLLMLLPVAFLLFLSLLLRYLNLYTREDFTSLDFEKSFATLFSLGMVLYSLLFLYSRLEGHFRWFIFLPALFGGVLVAGMTHALNQADFFLLRNAYAAAILLFFLVLVETSLFLSILQNWKNRSTWDKAFHLFAVAGILPLGVHFFRSLSGHLVGPYSEWAYFGTIAASFIPLVSSAASQIKFGRVSLVLNNTLQAFLFAAFTFLTWLILREILLYFNIGSRYRPYLEITGLISIILIFRSLVTIYEGRLRQFFVLARQSRKEKMERFISLIPQYTSSNKLRLDLLAELRAFLGVEKAALWFAEEQGWEPTGLSVSDIEALSALLLQKEALWLSHSSLSPSELPPESESKLKSAGYAFANAFLVKEGGAGTLLLGPKKRGVYNLGDLEILSRIIQQTRLTLGVLHLLERERLLLEKNYEANLTALRSQINPHFLFNTLNTISALIHDAPDQAESAVEKLAFIFRYTLKHSSQTFMKLRDELNLVRTYLEIEQIRFGKRLNLHFDLDDSLLDAQLPAFVLQTIVENCIKHGIARITENGQVSISVQRDGQNIRCQIFDNGPGIDLSRLRASTGLSNILTRMAQIYGREDLLLFENTGNGTLVTVLIPATATP